jgi:3-oxoacyl-[acyl-carrier-protein] synthase II
MWSNLVAGESGIDRLQVFDPGPYETKVAGHARDFRPEDYLARKQINALPRQAQMAVVAASLARRDAGLHELVDPERTGVFLGTSIGPLALTTEQQSTFMENGIARVHPMGPAHSYPGVAASEVAIQMAIKGPVMTVSTACTSGADAIGLGLAQIRAGMVDVALVGASEAPLFPLLFAAFDRLGLMSRWQGDPREACRPFAADRLGIVLSEGAAVCVLESEASAKQRGARILAELAGFGATCDAYHQLHQLPSGEEAARAMRLALRDADVDPGEVDYISAHGTATPSNDPIETSAAKQVFGERAHSIPMSSTKSMTGHLMGACGPLALIACVMAINKAMVPPTINLSVRDPACDLDYVPNRARAMPVRTAMSNTFGFGARNASLVLKAVS